MGTRQILNNRSLFDLMAKYSRNTDPVAVPAQLARSYAHSLASRLYFLRYNKQFPPHLQALAILYPNRGYATETSTPGGGVDMPPPGFNAEQAKKALPREELKKEEPIQPAFHSSIHEQTSIAKEAGAVSGVPKTKAMEDRSLAELASNKALAQKAEEQKSPETKEKEKKKTILQKVMHELRHYWDGTKLLVTEVKISSKLALKMAAGYELTRREHRQLHRTVQDMGRLVPFSVFVIVPFAELLLPFVLRIFPNMLPSTYEGQKAKEKKANALRTKRKEVSNFLRETLKESGLPVSVINAQKEEFTEFFRKVRSSGDSPTQEDVIKVCKIFKDDLTLDNLSRPQLVGMAKYMNLTSFGTDTMLRYSIRVRMRQIKRDDRAIYYEGVDSLSVPELQMAAASRGLRTQSTSPGRLRDDLQMWLDLRLKYGVPSTLLVLSNAFAYTSSNRDSDEISSQIDSLQAVLSSIPEELFHEIELEVHNAEGAATNKQRLEVLKEQQELIDEENEQNEENVSTPKDDENIDEEDQRKASAGDAPEPGQGGEGQGGEGQGDTAASAKQDAKGAQDSEKRAEKVKENP